MYKLFLNNRFYGYGDLEYIGQLIRDHVVVCKMYGKPRVELTIEKADASTKPTENIFCVDCKTEKRNPGLDVCGYCYEKRISG